MIIQLVQFFNLADMISSRPVNSIQQRINYLIQYDRVHHRASRHEAIRQYEQERKSRNPRLINN